MRSLWFKNPPGQTVNVKPSPLFSFKMCADKWGWISLRCSNNVRLKHQYRAMEICFAVIGFVFIWTTLLVQAANSVPDPSLALEFHPTGRICTLYMRKTTPGDADLWQKLIHDNKKSILCLYTAENKTVPDPDISFLEQCTINLIVGTDRPYIYVYYSVHSVRSSFHSSFIIVSNDGCRYHRYPKKNDLRSFIFYYFPSCEMVSNTIVPNAYLDYINSKGSEAMVTYLTVRQLFPVYSFDLQTMAPNHHNYFYANLKNNSIEHELKYCRRLVPILESNTLHYCGGGSRFIYHLKIYFNMTMTIDRAKMSGQQRRNVIKVTMTKFDFFWIVTYTEILDDSFFKFFYCLPNHTFLLTLEALASPFDLWTWIALLLSFILLHFVRLHSKTNMGRIEKILSNIGLLLEQSQPSLTTVGVLVFMSFLILTSIYKTRVTSDLLVPARVQSANNLSSLVQKGYTMTYNSRMSQVFDDLRTHPNLKPYNFVFLQTKFSDFRNVIVLLPIVNAEAKILSLRLERTILNMTCFSKESNVGKEWHSLTFFHPWYNRMKAFTKTFYEAGLFRFFWKIDMNNERIPTRSESRSRSNESFIKFKEAQPIFTICLLFLTGAIAIFAIESKKRLCLVSRLALKFLKSSLQLKKFKTGEIADASAAKGKSVTPTNEESVEENSLSENEYFKVSTPILT